MITPQRLALACLFVIVGACTHPAPKSKRTPASNRTVSAAPNKCHTAWKAALNSSNLQEIQAAIAACGEAVQAHCTEKADREARGSIVGFVNAVCYEAASFGANKAVNGGTPTPKCKEAHEMASGSPVVSDAKTSDDMCTTEVQNTCKDLAATKTEDPLAGPRCNLVAQHAALIETAGGDCDGYRACMKEVNPDSEHPSAAYAACQTDFDPNRTCRSIKQKRSKSRRD